MSPAPVTPPTKSSHGFTSPVRSPLSTPIARIDTSFLAVGTPLAGQPNPESQRGLYAVGSPPAGQPDPESPSAHPSEQETIPDGQGGLGLYPTDAGMLMQQTVGHSCNYLTFSLSASSSPICQASGIMFSDRGTTSPQQ